jgi:voltage-gated potassium channel
MDGRSRIRFPSQEISPTRSLGVRLLIAVGLIMLMTAIAYLDRHGYRDIDNSDVTLLDCLYYSTVSITTTGYGDITPVTDTARLLTTFLVTQVREI